MTNAVGRPIVSEGASFLLAVTSMLALKLTVEADGGRQRVAVCYRVTCEGKSTVSST